MKELAPGLFQGDLPSSLSDGQVKRNRVVAEVFGRLSNNASLPADQKFSVKYGGKDFTSLPDFAKALQADGYEVNVIPPASVPADPSREKFIADILGKLMMTIFTLTHMDLKEDLLEAMKSIE